MVDNGSIFQRVSPLNRGLGWRRLWLWVGAALVLAALVGSTSRPISAGASKERDHQVSGGARTIIEGGTGGAAPLPVTTVLAFHANGQGGAFECLALAPATATGAESGTFEVNAMYVTGKVTSVHVTGRTAVMNGTATVTGLGATPPGETTPFTASVTAGGPGATVVLTVSGLTFHEILLEGQITVD